MRGPGLDGLPAYVTPTEATRGPHGLFRYPAKYLPQIARALLEEAAPPDEPVLDPFAGSGTTLVEAALLGHPVAGLDLNPLATLVSAVKSRPADPERILSAGRSVIATARSLPRAPIPEFRNRDYWFPPESLAPLSRLRAAIREVDEPIIRSLLLVVFLSIVKAGSNASAYHYKLTRSREPDPTTGEDLYRLFERRIEKAAVRFTGFSLGIRPAVMMGDARRLPFPDDSFGAVVTHPPYSISFDFVRSFKLYVWWLDPDRDTVALDRDMVGNQRRFRGELPETGVPAIDDLSRRVHERDSRDGLAVAWFYRDMAEVFRECRRVIRPGGSLAFYVGDSRARWIQLEAPTNLGRLAEREGFEMIRRFAREVPGRVSSTIRQIHVEEALIFRA